MSDIRDTEVKIGTLLTIVSVGSIGLYLAGLYNLARNVVFAPSVRIHKVSSNGIEIRGEVNIYNPTNNTITVHQPFVAVYAEKKGLALANTPPNPRTYEVNRQGVTKIEDISLLLTWDKLATILLKLANSQENQVKLIFDIQVKVSGRYLLSKTIKKEVEETVKVPIEFIQAALNKK